MIDVYALRKSNFRMADTDIGDRRRVTLGDSACHKAFCGPASRRPYMNPRVHPSRIAYSKEHLQRQFPFDQLWVSVIWYPKHEIEQGPAD